MIVIEERLEELFSYLPATPDGFKPKYYYGDEKEINALIKLSDGAIYPLIYQTSNEWTENAKNPNTVEAELVFVLAVQNTVAMRNKERWATSYRNVLRPLYENIKTLFMHANIVTSDLAFTVSNHPNYSENEVTKDKNKFIDIVDALVIRVTIKISNGCINKNTLNIIKTWV